MPERSQADRICREAHIRCLYHVSVEVDSSPFLYGILTTLQVWRSLAVHTRDGHRYTVEIARIAASTLSSPTVDNLRDFGDADFVLWYPSSVMVSSENLRAFVVFGWALQRNGLTSWVVSLSMTVEWQHPQLELERTDIEPGGWAAGPILLIYTHKDLCCVKRG